MFSLWDRRLCLLLSVALTFELLSAQMGPYPGGQYPPGGYPPGRLPPSVGGTGIPRPGRKQKKTTPADKTSEPLLNLSGKLRKIDDASIVVEAQDTRILNFKLTDATKFLRDAKESKPADFHPGDHVLIEAKQDEQGYLYAVNVIFQKEATPADRTAASEAVDIPTPPAGNDDERPVLRRKDSPPQPAEAERPAPTTTPAPAKAERPAPTTTPAPAKADE